ncbi:hypothetical protein HWV62_4543 [Athelia sp. TMB]|nr:hypothetical protein HWV62_4543 [Athelia sp. TMB]
MSSGSEVVLSPIEKLAPQVLSTIGLYAGINCALGPPTDLVALLSSSQALYCVLSYRANQHLWAAVFSVKFDTSAVERRLGERWTTSGCIAAEGRKRFSALQRIRRGIVAHSAGGHLADLWVAYLMMLESDGWNESQLIEWANLPAYLYQVVAYRAATPHGSSVLWFSDTEGTALALWLLWMTSSEESIRDEHPQLRAEMRALLHTFLVAGYRYPSTHTPDAHFNLPLCPSQETIAAHCSGPPPKTRRMLHWNHTIKIAAPTLTSAAFLSTSVRIEALQDTVPPQSTGLPADRASADALGLSGKTQKDVDDFQYRVRTRFWERCPKSTQNSDLHVISSRRHDEEWHRLVSCYDPWDPQSTVRGAVYQRGVLAGTWDGRIMLPHSNHFWPMLLDPSTPTSSVGISQDRISLEIQEHHCLSPDEPLSAGTDATGFGDDILNAYLPRGTAIRHVQDGIIAINPVTGRQTRYETFVPGTESAPYSAAAMAKLQCKWIGTSGRADDDNDGTRAYEAHSGALPADQVMPIHDDELWEDTVNHLSSGVNDIIITGKVRLIVLSLATGSCGDRCRPARSKAMRGVILQF